MAFENIFREYDIRGRVNDEELNEKSVYKIIKGYTQFLDELKIKRAVVGYDNRTCSEAFAKATIKALTDAGIDVVYIGLCVTPTVYYAQYLYKCEGAVMITASHNPDGWSGFKLGKGYSKTLEANDILKIKEYIENPITKKCKKGNIVVADDVWEKYIDNIVSRIKMGENKPRVVLDAGNGAAGIFAYEIFQRLGCTTFQLNCDPDMTYPHYFPNPSDVKNRSRLKEIVTYPYIHADMGLSFDGDGDRLGVVDEKGNDIWSDVVLAVLSKQLLDRKKGANIVYDVKCSKTLLDVIEENDGNGVMWKTGHSYIKSKMHEMKADLAGERSGHLFFGGDDYMGFDDGLFAGAKICEYFSHQQKKMSEIIETFPMYETSPEIHAKCSDNIKYKIIDEITEYFKKKYKNQVIDINGARVQFENGWGLIRASSNLPEIVMIFEANTKEELLKIRQIFREVTEKYDEISKDWDNDIV